jgi:hypothetical protein
MASLSDFNPRNTALYEAQLWRAYYDHRWPQALLLLFRLLRSQFGLSAPQALRGACWGTLAGLLWKPVDHDAARVGRLLVRFYRGVRRATGADFDPTAAGAAELEYWAVHRALAGQEGSPELVEALAGITMAVYGLPREHAVEAAIPRAHACDLVDAITAGRDAPTAANWAAITAALRQAYELLHAAQHEGRGAGARRETTDSPPGQRAAGTG